MYFIECIIHFKVYFFFKSYANSFEGTWKNGRMEGPGILTYSSYKYHGNFDKNLPKGPGCFTFDGKWMQHGFYINIRDPAFDYVGAEELALEETVEPPPGVLFFFKK